MFQALRRIHVAASDFARSRRFYGEILGLPEAGGFENDWVEFALGPVLLKLTPLRPGEVPARNQVAAIFSTQALEPTLQTLKERGVTVTRGPAEEFTGRSAEILDPDGYRIIVFRASELHPDEEWVPMSKVDEKVRQKLAARRQKEKGRPRKSGKPRSPAKKGRKGTKNKRSAKAGARKPAAKRRSSPSSLSRKKRAKAASRRSGKKR
jgi:predicted enzyme related to lactoylglutathione lyase